ncbi:hypothetical protein CYV19_01895 [Natronobacterium gregoryi SP2]|uniref:Uncharacterized protein n=1 Tax=Natronobacterium gregoryi (strain ATCC 43098 / DSM 3393 / CCM 3738 / CIP 104747 / IAM 13177 / JCM 8860 / NBRC 102187 / NCIMB 2189 / SP2) TaxID=797304 RepID=A0A2J4JIY3_NATGS|nr:hypothetical protein CYV19_01895 [Natronobacterium gregoryi SP2]
MIVLGGQRYDVDGSQPVRSTGTSRRPFDSPLETPVLGAVHRPLSIERSVPSSEAIWCDSVTPLEQRLRESAAEHTRGYLLSPNRFYRSESDVQSSTVIETTPRHRNR